MPKLTVFLEQNWSWRIPLLLECLFPTIVCITILWWCPESPRYLIQKNKHIKLAGNDKLRIERELKEPKDRAQMVRDVLRSLGQPTTETAPA